MTMLNGRKHLLIWIPAVLICRSPDGGRVHTGAPTDRCAPRTLTLSVNRRKAPPCFLVTSSAAFAIPSMDSGAVLPRISPERTPVLPQWGGLQRCCGTMDPACGGRSA